DHWVETGDRTDAKTGIARRGAGSAAARIAEKVILSDDRGPADAPSAVWVNCATGTVFELQDALPHQSPGYQPGYGIGLLKAVAFKHEKEEGLVLLNRATHAAAKAVVNPDSARLTETAGIVGETAGFAGTVQRPGVSVVVGVLIVLVGCTMPGIAAAAGNHLHLAAAGARKGVGVIGHHAHFLEAFHGRGNGRTRGGREAAGCLLGIAAAAFGIAG